MKMNLLNKKLDYPACGAEAMSVMRKINLGGAASVDCQSCGVALTVSWVSLLPMGIMIFFSGMFMAGKPFVLLVVPIVLMFFVVWISQVYFAPLKRAPK